MASLSPIFIIYGKVVSFSSAVGRSSQLITRTLCYSTSNPSDRVGELVSLRFLDSERRLLCYLPPLVKKMNFSLYFLDPSVAKKKKALWSEKIILL